MATGVISSVIIKVHQSLHGYADGHRQIACSTTLSSQDAKQVLIMSDVSGSGVVSEGSSYLTGYPLQDAGMYALARTWAAPEMPRPGCVWTHTIFIDYPDLAKTNSPSSLNKLFVRPNSSSFSSYGMTKSLELKDYESEISLSFQEEEWLERVLSALYHFPKERIVARRDSIDSVEALTLKIWEQQWPRLRRSFRFCTFTTKDRSASGSAFDLQILPNGDSTNRIRLLGTQEAPNIANQQKEGWLSTLREDALKPNLYGLRDTLKKLGADVLGGREAMPAFCEFHQLTSESASISDLNKVIRMLDYPHLLSASDFARTQVVDQLLSNVEKTDQIALEFLWNNWIQIDPIRLQQRFPTISAALWRASPKRLLAAMQNNGDEFSAWATKVFKAIPAETLLENFPSNLMQLRELSSLRPELFEMQKFWSLVDIFSPSDLYGINLSNSAVHALIQGLTRDSAINVATQVIGSMRVLEVLQTRSSTDNLETIELRWVQYCVKNTSEVATFLSRTLNPSASLLLAISEFLNPDAVPSQYRHDPWNEALFKLKIQTNEFPNRLAAYGFARALGWNSQNRAGLLQITFEQLYIAVENSTIKERDWQLVVHRLPWTIVDKRENRCMRLRKAVIGCFIERDFPVQAFALMTVHENLFVLLMEEALDHWGGKRFLKSVEASLENEHDKFSQTRRKLIRWFISSRKI